MNAVERVEQLAAGERHLTQQESRYWCNQYLMLCRELAIQVDQLRMQIYHMQYAKIEAVVIPQQKEENVVKKQLSKSEQTSIRMKEYWKRKKAGR